MGLGLAWAAPAAQAQTGLPPADDGSIYTIRIENDVTGTTDEYYTSGEQVGWTGPHRRRSRFHRQCRPCGAGRGRPAPGASTSASRSSRRRIRSSIRPTRTTAPYAATLLLTGQLIQDTEQYRTRVGMQAGVLGPDAGGQVVQNGFHGPDRRYQQQGLGLSARQSAGGELLRRPHLSVAPWSISSACHS